MKGNIFFVQGAKLVTAEQQVRGRIRSRLGGQRQRGILREGQAGLLARVAALVDVALLGEMDNHCAALSSVRRSFAAACGKSSSAGPWSTAV
jgi:hypothetical protein